MLYIPARIMLNTPTMSRDAPDFRYSSEQEPHRGRTKAILKEHPDVRQLIGKNPYSIFIICGVLAVQFGTAYLLRSQPWWLALLIAYVVGAYLSHAQFVMIHDCAHNLLFKRRASNYAAAILANTMHTIPSAITFSRYHLRHHAFQGVYELDGDIPSRWEARMAGRTPIGKALWLLMLPVLETMRTARLREVKPINGWVVGNFAAVMGVNAAVLLLFGPISLLYLFAAAYFSVSLHPLGARWIQEHYLFAPPQETYSYYGPLNVIAFNVGYHNEHHDFPSVPWNRLRELKRSAPRWYSSLVAHSSWPKLLVRFLFDPQIRVFSRMVRSERGRVSVSSEEYYPDRPREERMHPADGEPQ